MFQRFRTWLLGGSGLKEATRDAAREATREGLLDGIRLGIEDAMSELNGLVEAPKPIEIAQTNGHEIRPREPITASEMRGMRKADLLTLADDRGINVDDSMTVADLRELLIAHD